MAKQNRTTAGPTTTYQAGPVMDQVIEETKAHQSIQQRAAAQLGVETKKLPDLLRHVWSVSKGQPPLSALEMYVGISLIARYELDPIAKEVYVTRSKDGRLLTIVSIDGWVKILDRTDHYDGFEQMDEYEPDTGRVIAVTTRIFSTRRSHPTSYRGLASEYASVGGYVSKQMPVHMLRIFSFKHAARLFCPVGGSVMDEASLSAVGQAGAAYAFQTTNDVSADDLLKMDETKAEQMRNGYWENGEQPAESPSEAPDDPQDARKPQPESKETKEAQKAPPAEQKAAAAESGVSHQQSLIAEKQRSEDYLNNFDLALREAQNEKELLQIIAVWDQDCPDDLRAAIGQIMETMANNALYRFKKATKKTK